jgi:hypothetical protein
MPQVRGGPIRYLISKTPRPETLVAWDDNGAKTTVNVGKGATRFADAEAAVGDPVKIHALDMHGAVIRVYDRPAEEGAEGAELGRVRVQDDVSIAQALLGEIPKAITSIAAAMGSAADRACARQQESFATAFTAQGEVIKALSLMMSQSMQQTRELQSELTGLARELREQMLDAAEVEAEVVKASAEDGSQMKALTELAVKVAGPALVDSFINGGAEKKAS